MSTDHSTFRRLSLPRHGLLPAALLLLLAACNRGHGVTITEYDMNELRHLKEVDWPRAYRTQDTALLDRILGDDFKMIDADGNSFDKKSELDWVKNNPWTNDTFYFEITRFEILENGTAIISGTGHMTGDSTETTYQSSNILIKRQGRWQAVSSHVSGVREVSR